MAILLIFCASMITNAQTLSQNKRTLGVSIGAKISGNGHGSIYIPQLCLGKDRNSLMLGACLQKQAMQFNGARVAYSFVMSGRTKQEINADEEDTTEVYQYFAKRDDIALSTGSDEARINFKLFVYAEYLRNNLLSHCTQKMEAHVNRVEGMNWKTATLSTVESGVGAQIGVRLAKNVYWNSSVAVSFYYHTTYIQNMHHEQFSPCITLGTNITIPDLHV